MKMNIVGMKDIGGANAVVPVGLECAHMGNGKVLFYADEPAFSRFRASHPVVSASCPAGELLRRMRPGLVITSTCSPGGSVPISLTVAAHEERIPVVAVQDFWGNHKKNDWAVKPDLVCVQDRFAKKLVLDSWPDFPEELVVVTGQPAFDRLHGADTASARHDLRRRLGLNMSWPVIHFSGQAWGMSESVGMVMEALNLLKLKVYFILREHPRVLSPQSEQEKAEFPQIRMDYIKARYCFRYGEFVETQAIASSDPITRGASINVGMYSTSLLESCYLRIPCISVWPREAAAALAMETKGSLTNFPPAELGACFQATDAAMLASQIEACVVGDDKLREAQEEHYKADGKNTDRVIRAIIYRL